MILVNGDSFTYGEELDYKRDAWPFQRTNNVINIASPGNSNDAIIKSTVQWIENNANLKIFKHAIIAWTTPHRIEVNGKHLTPTSHKRYGSICDQVFLDWNETWAIEKFYTQVVLLDAYLSSKKIDSLFIRTFDVPDSKIGNWMPGSIVEWMGDCPKGPGGHPLELGHKRIADKVYEHIRSLGWLS